MRMYAATPVRASAQLIGDAFFVAWLVGSLWLASQVHDTTLQLAGPSRHLTSSSTSLSEHLGDAGGFLGDVPLIGGGIAAPFDEASRAADGIAAAGRDQVAAVERLAFWLGLAVGAVPILGICALYLPLRWRFVRRATAGQRFIDANEDLDLFALRALANQPMHVLAKISDDPAGAWRRREPGVVRRLAELELRDHGLKPPRVA